MSMQEKIVCAAVKIKHQCGEVTEGLCVTYGDKFHGLLKDIHESEDCCTVDEEIKGFVTCRGRFLDAEEAFSVALKSGQVMRPPIAWSSLPPDLLLKPEDLY